MDLKFEILKYSHKQTCNNAQEGKGFFMFPYYNYIYDAITKIIDIYPFLQTDDIVEQLSYQVVSYAYNTYLKFVYPFEFNLAKENNFLKGSTEEEQSLFFRDTLSSNDEWITYFFEKYPKLLSILESYSVNIMHHIDRLLSALKVDIESSAIKDLKITEIKLFEGDLHEGNCVSSVLFFNGTKLYYKPRGAANEKFIADTISVLDKMGLSIHLGIPAFIDRNSYSWHLQVKPCDMENCDSINEYYYNLGKIQAFLYLFGAQDIIPDNLMAFGNCPYIIDCESVVSKKFKHLDSTKISAYLQSSVLETGILPDWMFNDANERAQISSVLFEFDAFNYHLPKKEGKCYTITTETLQDFEKGFADACDFMRAHRLELSRYFNSYDFNSICSRVLLHPTVIYSYLLTEMVTPPYLHGDKDIKELIEPIVRKESYGVLSVPLIHSIANQIEKGNIPYYFMYLNKNSLYTLPNSIVVDEWISVAPKENSVIVEKLSTLSTKVQEEQLCMIDESVNFFIDVVGTTNINKVRILPVGKDSLDRNVLWQAIERIEKEIRKRMIQIDNEIGFVCRTRNVYDGKFQVCLMNDSLYDGLLGVCLFYLTLFTYSHNIQHKEIAHGIFQQLCEHRDVVHIGVDKSEIAISPLSGIMGLLYIMEVFPDLYNASVYQSIIKEVKELIPITTQFDYMSGIAGVILFTTQCKLMKETDKLTILKTSGERLLQLAKNIKGKTYWTYTDGNKIIGKNDLNLGGFAHGSSSMATAIFLLYKQFGDIRYLEAFKHSLLHDRSFYSDKIQGWIDGRNPSYEEDSGSWCHGATGIALSRLILASEGFSDKTMVKELKIAVNQIEKRIGYNLSVCHGSMGNLEILHLLSMQNDTKTFRWVNSIATEISKGQDIICGDDNRNSQVGLFMGFAGIGYQLLKFYDWKNIPSILCLEIAHSTFLNENKSGCRKAHRVG